MGVLAGLALHRRPWLAGRGLVWRRPGAAPAPAVPGRRVVEHHHHAAVRWLLPVWRRVALDLRLVVPPGSRGADRHAAPPSPSARPASPRPRTDGPFGLRRRAPSAQAAPPRRPVPASRAPRILVRRHAAAGVLATAALPPRPPAPAAEVAQVLARRVRVRGQRVEERRRAPSTEVYRRPAPPPAEAPPEPFLARPALPRRPAPPAAPPIPAPALAGLGGDLDRLTEQVVRRIDRRMTAWRERTGRV